MREVLYYQGPAAVCLLLDEERKIVVARGVSICAHGDQFVKKLGRVKAQGRARQAFEGCVNIEPIKDKQGFWVEVTSGKRFTSNFYATFSPELSEFETQLVAKFVK